MAQAEVSPRHIFLDGRTLEGGGQLVRNALALSALTGQPVTIDHVRGNRGGKTGLKASHAAAVKLLAEISGSKVDSGGVGSHCVTFLPPSNGDKGSTNTSPAQNAGDAHLVPSSHIAVQSEYNIRLPTPGSVFLIFQALYPYLLYVGSRAAAKSIKVTITGGTHSTNSPSYDYASQVMAPNFARLGLPPLTITLHRRGWSTGAVGMGSVSFFIEPLRDAQTESTVRMQPRFPRVDVMDHECGRITRFDLTVLAPDDPVGEEGSSSEPLTVRKYIEQETRRVLRRALEALGSTSDVIPHSNPFESDMENTSSIGEHDLRIPIEIHTSESTSHISRLYILIVAHTSTGFRIGHDYLGHSLGAGSGRGKKHKKPNKDERAHRGQHQQQVGLEIIDDLIDECVQGLVKELTEKPGQEHKSSGFLTGKRPCVDKYMRDQIVVFEALGRLNRDETADGRIGEQEDERYWTLHTQTAQWVCREMLDLGRF